MASFWTYVLLYVILFNMLNVSHPTAPTSSDSASLYNGNDKIITLTSRNFSSTIYGSETAWLIEFYASWCGHCHAYASTYREMAIDTWSWGSIVRIAAINCYGEERDLVCRRHGIHHYPTLTLIPPRAQFDNASKLIFISPGDIISLRQDLIKALERMRRKNDSWPHFTPVNRLTIEEVYARAPSKVRAVFMVIEKRLDFTGRQIMLDFSKYSQQLSIFRTTTDGKLWRKFHINATEVPALFVILRNRTAQRIHLKMNDSNSPDYRAWFHQAIRLYLETTQLISNFDDHEWDEMLLSKNALKSAGFQRKRPPPDQIINKDDKVKMIDLELALFHMLHREIPSMKEIQGQSYRALLDWLIVLTQYFPGRPSVMLYLKEVFDKVRQESNGFSGDRFATIVNSNHSFAYIPDHRDQYQTCAGSAPQYRGYPCALWLLFHTLTVSQVRLVSDNIDVMEIPSAIRNYIQHFFACRKCSMNFIKETHDIDQLDRKNSLEAVKYLWKVHNAVNHRLLGDITEDPTHPKVLFPSQSQCPDCRLINLTSNESQFHLVNTMNFLLRHYSIENISTSFDAHPFVSTKFEQNRTTSSNHSSPLIPNVIPHFPWTIILILVLCLYFYRRYSCRQKSKRHKI